VKALKCVCNVATPLAPDLLSPLYEPTKIGWDRLVRQWAKPDAVRDRNEEVDRV